MRCRNIIARNPTLVGVCVPVSSHDPEDDSIALTVEARPQRRGRAVRLVVNPAEVSTVTAPESPALVKVLAQGQLWLEQLLDGKVSSLRSIANSAGLSERYVSQVIRSAFLAPDLVETVLQGRQPAHLTVRQVTKQLPCDWSEQRRLFGLAPGAKRSVTLSEGAAPNQ